MKILPSAINVYKFGRVCSQFGIKYLLIGAAVMTSFSVVLWFGTLGRGNSDVDVFTMLNVIITIILAITYGLGRALLRNRTINGETFTPERCAFITDELRRRGVTSTRRFIKAHPDHVHYAKELTRTLWGNDALASRTEVHKIEALLYSEDTDPARTKETLVNIIADRRITDPYEVRALLHTLLRTETPLGAGVL